MNEEYEIYRRDKIREGLEFQDFIMERLHLIGMVLQPYNSFSGQKKGENLLGLEIKYQPKMSQYGSMNIEVGEKARPRDGDFARSGIYRDDNTWLYGLGNMQVFYIFSKTTLRAIYKLLSDDLYSEIEVEDRTFRIKRYRRDTSIGFLLPLDMADRINARKVSFSFDGSIKSVEIGKKQTRVDLKDIDVPKSYQMSMQLK